MDDITDIINDIDLDEPEAQDDIVAKLKKKKRVNSKKKGNRYELQIANELTSLFDDTFRRNPNSGAFFGGGNWNTKNKKVDKDIVSDMAGDIITPRWFPFSIECKNYDDTPKLHKLYTGTDKKFNEWVAQAKADALKSEKQWILFFKITKQRESFTCLDTEYLNSMLSVIDTELPDSYMTHKDATILTYKYFINEVLIPYINKRKGDT